MSHLRQRRRRRGERDARRRAAPRVRLRDRPRRVDQPVDRDAVHRRVQRLRRRRDTLLPTDPVHGRSAFEFEAFRYQYPDGEVVNGSEFRAAGGEVERTPDETWVRFGDDMEDGRLAISASGSPRRFTTLTYVEGSYAVTLPPGFSTDMPIVGHVSPRNHEIETVDGRDRITWDSVTSGSVVVQSYRETDLLVFGVILVIGAVAAVVGTVYFRRQLEELRQRRRQMGLGVYEDDEDENK
ncbi:DUF5803 family protein [Halorubrum saccharovorum]|uniref:DUF5803 family protein n=1 Tax=Halorubrum saccharovorum TaxID=2248 RepID=UPI001F18ADA4